VENRKAVQAAFKQVSHLAASERAWIIVSSRFPGELHPGDQETVTRFRWDMKNVGKSPARLLEFNGVASSADRIIPFLDPPRFLESPQPLNKLLLVPNDSWGMTRLIERGSILPEDPTAISYGYIKYLDIFGKEHTTRSCQKRWVDPRGGAKMFLPYT
jgi:hypothetical protein